MRKKLLEGWQKCAPDQGFWFSHCWPFTVQRNRSLIVSLEFPTSSPYRSFLMPVQFGHFSARRTRKQSFDQGQRFSWLKGSWAAGADHYEYLLPGSPMVPLAHRQTRQDVIGEVCRRLYHVSRVARGAHAPALTGIRIASVGATAAANGAPHQATRFLFRIWL